MVFTCYICSKKLSSVVDVTRHLRSDHVLFPHSSLKLKCCYKQCSLAFKTYSGLRRHMIGHPQNSNSHNSDDLNILVNCNAEKDFGFLVDINSDADVNSDIESSLPGQLDDTESDCSELASIPHAGTVDDKMIPTLEPMTNFALKLNASSIPKSTIKFILEGTDELVTGILDDVSRYIIDHNITNNPQLQHYLNEKKNAMKVLNSQYKINKLYSDMPDFVHPMEIVIGTRFDQVFDKPNNSYRTVPVPCKFIYMPILETIKLILTNNSVMETLNSEREVEQSTYKDICDGTYYRTNNFYQQTKNALQLQFYYDDFETTNPLGSKTVVHKIGGIYFVIRNLPPHMNSQLDNIHVAALFYVLDLKNFGFDMILKPIVRDIKILELDGVDTGTVKLKGSIIALSFDNLGGNTLLGLPESFSATHFCRICTASKDQARVMTRENKLFMRTSDPVIGDLGIRRNCLLNELQYFNVFESLSVDIGHDILEGIVQCEIKLFLKFITELNLITLLQINERIKVFCFGKLEMSNKPSPISLDKQGYLIGQRAVQSWCLIRYLPLILSDIVNENSSSFATIKK